jgi:hypothetical protein
MHRCHFANLYQLLSFGVLVTYAVFAIIKQPIRAGQSATAFCTAQVASSMAANSALLSRALT